MKLKGTWKIGAEVGFDSLVKTTLSFLKILRCNRKRLRILQSFLINKSNFCDSMIFLSICLENT